MKNYSLLLPPPNVTGVLHLGHALNTTLQDILAKWNIINGQNVYWQSGLDHAGIATQIIVERELAKKNLSKDNMTREEFLTYVFKWKEESGGQITQQQKRLNLSLNSDNVRFTMDKDASENVVYAFNKLYEAGLIYKDKRLVNYDPILQTAVSDLEVTLKEQKGCMYYLKYLINDNEYITIATSRPETIFADSAIAVHPSDERYTHLIGKHVTIPLTTKKIPIIADDYLDMEFGSGALKITPAHDFNDFDIGKKHNLEMINILNSKGCLNDLVPEQYQNLSVKKAREKIETELEALGFLIKKETYKQSLPINPRSNAVIEPYLTNQWFLDTKPLALEAIKVIQNKEITIIPEQFEKTYFGWLENIEPWCISRQLLWGHQIPAWYNPNDQKIFVAHTKEEAEEKAKQYYGESTKLIQESDVLDTWFSSSLWPMITTIWSKDTSLHKNFPFSMLITGTDILFFWVARMIMMSLFFTKKIPFLRVYLHSLIRDEKGEKMSKSKGNVLDPIDLIESYGEDSLRLCLASMTLPGRDIKIGTSHIENFRNFITKIKNSHHFLHLKKCEYDKDFDYKNVSHPLNKWIISKVLELHKNIKTHMEEYRFDLMVSSLYQFLWKYFCDHYVECFKFLAEENEFKKTAAFVFERFLEMLYPFAPKTAEQFSFTNHFSIQKYENITDNTNCSMWFELIKEIRSLRVLMGLSPSAHLNVQAQIPKEHQRWVAGLGRLSFIAAPKGQSVSLIIHGEVFDVYIPSNISNTEVKFSIEKKIEKLKKDKTILENKIGNENYQKNKPDLWEKDKEKLIEVSKDYDLALNILKTNS